MERMTCAPSSLAKGLPVSIRSDSADSLLPSGPRNGWKTRGGTGRNGTSIIPPECRRVRLHGRVLIVLFEEAICVSISETLDTIGKITHHSGVSR